MVIAFGAYPKVFFVLGCRNDVATFLARTLYPKTFRGFLLVLG
jgi:hypothetical protein